MSRDPLAWLDEHPEGNSDYDTYREQLATGLDNEHTRAAALGIERNRRRGQRVRRVRRLVERGKHRDGRSE